MSRIVPLAVDENTTLDGARQCAVCGHGLSARAKVRFAHCQLRECDDCGSWIYFPRSSSRGQAAIHDTAEYFDHQYFAVRRKAAEAIRRRCRDVFARLSPFVDIGSIRGQRVLDIGCDTGGFLEAVAKEFGVVPVGIDVARRALAEAKQRGIEVYQTDIEGAPQHLRDFPVITAVDLLEHIADPVVFLREIRSRLRPGGVVYLETPNIRSAVYRVGSALCGLTRGRPNWLFSRLFPAEHIQYFTLDSLQALGRACGLDVVRIRTRVLPWTNIAAPTAVRAMMSALQAVDQLTKERILICAVLRRPLRNTRPAARESQEERVRWND